MCCTIATCFAADYFWVGGGGNWSDINHWAKASGGTVKHTVVPSVVDNVFFDQNSRFLVASNTIVINVNTATCSNMNWGNVANNPQLIGANSSSALHVYGALVLQATVGLSVGITFISNGNQTVITNGCNVNGNFVFTGGGTYALLDNLQMSADIEIVNTSFIATNKIINANDFGGVGINTSILDITNTQLNLNIGYKYTGATTNVLAANSNIVVNGNFTGEVNDVYNVVLCKGLIQNGSTFSGGSIVKK